jgi:hypothetical protein
VHLLDFPVTQNVFVSGNDCSHVARHEYEVSTGI